jgi:hypothetical protein
MTILARIDMSVLLVIWVRCEELKAHRHPRWAFDTERESAVAAVKMSPIKTTATAILNRIGMTLPSPYEVAKPKNHKQSHKNCPEHVDSPV